MPSSQRTLANVLAEYSPRLLSIDGVTTVYESATEGGTPCVKIGVVEDTEEIRKRLPDSIEGYAVLIHETGPIGPR